MEQLLCPRVVGRDAELVAVHETVAAAARGFGGGTVLLGEAGAGKSRLVDEARDAARARGLTVLGGRCVEVAGVPFGPFVEAVAAAERAGAPRGAALAAARTVLDRPAGGRDVSTPTEVAEAVLRLLREAAGGGGALLVVEDLHWADLETVAALDHLLAHSADHGAGCLVTLRPGGDAHGRARRWGDTRTARLVELLPLSGADVERMVRLCLGVDAVVTGLLEFVRERADGLPFLVEELLAGLRRSGALLPVDGGWQVIERRLRVTVPPTLADAVTAGFTALHPRTQGVLQAASLLGRRVAWDLLPRVTGLAPDVVLASLREATYAGFLAADPDDPGALRFRHALIRDHIAALLLAPERAVLARRALDAVDDVHPGLPGPWCALGAQLADMAGDRGRTARLLTELGGRELRRGALATATTHLERALELLDPEDSLLALEELVAAHALAGDVDAALERGVPALDERRARADAPARLLELELALGRALLIAGRYVEARRHAVRAGAVDTASAAVLSAQVDVSAGDPEQAEATARAAIRSGRLAPDAACEAWEVVGRAARLRDVEAAEQAFTTALDLAERHGLAASRARALHELGTVDLLDTMRTDRLGQARAAAIETGAAATLAVVDFHLAEALVARQRVAEGREAAGRAIATARRIGSSVLAPALLTLARSHAHELAVEAMEGALDRARACAPGDPEIEAGEWGRVRAMLALHRGEPAEARAALDRAVVALRAVPGHHFPHWGLWALLHAVTGGDPDTVADAASAPGGDTRFNRALVRTAEAVWRGPRDPRAAEERFVAGVADLGAYVDGEWLVHLVGWLAAPAAHRDGWGDPVGWLQAAVRWFADHDRPRLATSCRTGLRAVGGPVPRRGRGTSSVPDELLALGVSSREVDVLRLLGRRLTNNGIAEALVLSPRTVEKHVASLLRKTGSADRAALEAHAAVLSARP
ncbi:helix-turn-helix transcriptional regulator [Actinomycetospora cinnamomea]|uniref:helix-turn-helix transcriptional regulator n=1 Tax=Actinomycetospora cinnamomea TaxID=663609 RepID=UPI001057698C|nr:AAA family ATPase [Actinomycetospora cinnamomea]